MLGFEKCIIEIKKIKTKFYCLIIGGQGTNMLDHQELGKCVKKNELTVKMIPLNKEKFKQIVNFLKMIQNLRKL